MTEINVEIQKTKNSKIYNNKSVSVSGPSAVGKSTVGKQLADGLGISFYDLDEETVSMAGFATTKDVIRTLGHGEFKKIQSKCLENITKENKRYVLACGGEIIRPGYDEAIIRKNRDLIKKYTYNICLIPSNDIDETVDILYPRLNDGKRDTRTSSREEFKHYVEISITQYFELANLVVITHRNSVGEVSNAILKELQTNSL